MKKLMAFTIALLFLMVMASAVFAAETTFKGEYQVKAWAEWNFDKKPGYSMGDDPQYDGWFEQRFRLTITHTRSEFLKAVVKFDLVDDAWGMQRNLRINNSIDGSYFDWAYIEFSLPKIGKFTVGKQPVVLGYGLLMGVVNPGVDGVKWENTWGPVTAAAMYFKVTDNVTLGSGSKYQNRDTDLWAVDFKIAPNDNHLIELFGGMALANTSRNGSREWQFMGYSTGFIAPEENWTLGFVGLRYTGEIADMITLKAEYSWVFGGMQFNRLYATTADRSLSVEGWNLYLDASYHNDLLRVGLAFLMGSGAKHNWGATSIHNINMSNLWWDSSAFTWANIIGSGHTGLFSNYQGPGFDAATENLTSVKLYFNITPLCCDGKLSINAAVIWAKWTDPVGTGLPEMCAYPHPARMYNSNYAYTSWNDSTDLGWEFDLGFSYEIMEGLTYTFAGGVLLTGDSWDYVDSDGTREDWGPIWSITNTLKYTF